MPPARPYPAPTAGAVIGGTRIVIPARQDRDVPHVTALTVAIPDAVDFVAALSAITTTEPEWHTAVVAGTSDRGRTCQIAGVEVFEEKLSA